MGFGWCAGLGRAVGMLGGGAQPWLSKLGKTLGTLPGLAGTCSR